LEIAERDVNGMLTLMSVRVNGQSHEFVHYRRGMNGAGKGTVGPAGHQLLAETQWARVAVVGGSHVTASATPRLSRRPCGRLRGSNHQPRHRGA
jgi:hypothetical protein